MPIQILENVKTPWQISPSAPMISICFSEVDQAGSIEFVGFFGEHSEKPLQLVKVYLKGLGWIRVSPPVDDRSIFNESLFDLSAVEGRKSEEESISEWLERFKSSWRSSQFCPDPHCYVVSNSLWIKEKKADKWGCKHYLFIGDRSCVEVLAVGFDWKALKVLTD
jgi:hypothetical protein